MYKTILEKNKETIKEVLDIAVPAVVDVFVQTLLVTIDMIMVGTLGSIAISSIGIGSAPFNTVIPGIMAIGTGVSALVSRAYGAKNKDDAKKATVQSLIISAIITISIIIVFLSFSKEIVTLVARNKISNLSPAISYYRILTLVFFPAGFNIVFFNIFRALGKTKIPMIQNSISLVINVILNYIFIFILKMGVRGAAIATVISILSKTFISIYIIFIKKSEWVNLSKEDFKFDLSMIKRIAKISIPAAIEQSILRFGMLIFEIMIISLGSLNYAAHKIAGTAESYSFSLGFAFSFAATALVGQELGKGNPKMAMRKAYICMTMAIVVMFFMGILFFIVPNLFVFLFTKEIGVRTLASAALRIVSICQPFLAVTMVLSGALRGAGATKSVLMVTLLGIFLIRIPTTYLFLNILNTGLLGAWVVMTLDLGFRSILVFFIFKKGSWQYLKV